MHLSINVEKYFGDGDEDGDCNMPTLCMMKTLDAL